MLFLLFIFFLIEGVLGSIEIEKEPVVDVIIPEIGEKAVYELKITNLGQEDSFSIYSSVGEEIWPNVVKVDIWPNETFTIGSGESKEIKVEIMPEKAILQNPGIFNLFYKIESSTGRVREDVMLVKIVNLKDVIEINSYNINLESEKAVVFARNKGSLPFPKIKAHFYSVFFDFEEEFSLGAYEKREFGVNLNKEDTRKLAAGPYIITTDIETYNATEKIEDTFRFTEKENVRTEEDKSGILIFKTEIKKINEGNLPVLVQVKINKNIISRLFTNFNIEPSAVTRKGLVVTYIFQDELEPAETYAVRATTSWLYPLLLIGAVILIFYLARAYVSTFLLVKKRATFVRTKGGEFALKVTLIAKAKKFVEKVKIIDKVPLLVKVHERFGVIEPDKVDIKNRRLEWNVESLQPGEERIFSYIIYSKVAPIGKFEIPQATAVYERDGKIHETNSNKVFFLTEQRSGK